MKISMNSNIRSTLSVSDLGNNRVMRDKLEMTVLWLSLFLMCHTCIAVCPSRCFCDDERLNASCENAGLEVVPIQLNPDLKIINLRNNKISSVHYTLGFYANLRDLDISCNKITTLGVKNFDLQTKLETLNVSDNNITALDRDIFQGLKSLKILDLSNNVIEHLGGSIFSYSTELTHLNVSNNHITAISVGVFDTLKNLHTLNLDGNQLLGIPTHVLRNLHSLHTLKIGENLIETIRDDSFPTLRDLKVLTLQYNVISEIHLSAFEGVQKLECLNLSNNNISSVPTQQLSKVPNLQELDISGNKFTVIGPVVFQNLFDLRALWMCQLMFLKRVDARAFVDNIKLETVVMDGNINLETLPTRLFHGNPLLTHLSVRGASLTSLDASHFPLDQLHYLYLGNNPLRCNCSMLWLWLLARKQQGIMLKNMTGSPTFSPDILPHLDIDQIRCKNPYTGGSMLMVDVPESEVRCDATWLAIIVVTTIVVFSLMSIACTVMYFLGNGGWCKKRKNQPEDMDTEIPTRSFHSHHHHNHHQHLCRNHHQNGTLLMFLAKHSNVEGTDEEESKNKDSINQDVHIQRPVATWESLEGENGIPDARNMNMCNPQYTANGILKDSPHVVYV